jgi:hypothetical protein
MPGKAQWFRRHAEQSAPDEAELLASWRVAGEKQNARVDLAVTARAEQSS